VKILYVTPVPPLPIRSGIEIRLFHLVAPLCSRHEVTLLCFAPDSPQAESTQRELASMFRRVEMVERDEHPLTRLSIVGQLRQMMHPPSEFTQTYSTSTRMREVATRYRLQGDMDVILVNGLSMSTYFPGEDRAPTVLDMFDSISLHKARALRTEHSLKKKLSAFSDWVSARRWEQIYCRRYRDIVLTSEADARIIKKAAPGCRVWTVTNGIDYEYFSQVRQDASDPVAAFVGVMDYPPNVDAVLFFARQVMPRVWREQPAARLLVVGRRPSIEIAQLASRDRRIVVTGEVDDIRPYLAECQICVCPMRSGAGIKNKILEAWASGKPVVATTISTQGLSARNGDNVLLADRPQELARAVLTLFARPDMREALASAGRRTVQEGYRWSAKAAELEAILETAVGRALPARP
jgi:polysaccharide biosynthesis protein PslH